MSLADLRSKDWYRVKDNPQFDKVHGDRLFYFEPGGEYGGTDEDGVLWFRLNCSYWFGDWIEEHGGAGRWRIYGGHHRAIYIVREDLMTLIRLKWL